MHCVPTRIVAAKAQNISAYLLGQAPDPASPAQLRGFIAKHATDGSTTYYMPPAGSPQGVAIPTKSSGLSWSVQPVGTTFKTPGTINSGRIYIVDGYLDFFPSASGQIVQPDPHNPGDIASKEPWGFIELSHGKANGNEDMTVNLSFVDWVSLPLGMNVTFKDGNGQKTVSIPGLKADGLPKVCDALSSLDSFWPRLCLRAADKTPLRVMSPEKYTSLNPNDKDAANYYEPYITQVWDKYKSADLKINTQTAGPTSNAKVDNGALVTCRVGSDNILHCDNDAGDFSRPVSKDIWGCNSGPFANPTGAESWSRARVRPRLCAAFVRSTLHLDAPQPSSNVGSSQYYKEKITNHYSRVVHENLIGGMGYAFSYDDVSPSSTENSAGLVSMTNPLQLDVFINN
ncbi:hypothetical protein O1611_g8782 [Lasiodiplodia mahajangana]|uniref:Uncharacterized protein n=1 Tax=Lasiodiplodia mahajangana TaxID=1108764 RepID=A0ACC2JCD6_9PEZI|nr:hypothetical protein O1611_g8782 [Lasiodiplodia mahajangana]